MTQAIKFIKTNKASILLLLFLSFSMLSYSQETTTFYTKSLAMRFKGEDETWKDWTEWYQADLVIKHHSESKTITINTKPKEIYTIIGTSKELVQDGKTELIMNATDDSGISCAIIFSYDKDYNFKIYIEYGNLIAVYKISDQETITN